MCLIFILTVKRNFFVHWRVKWCEIFLIRGKRMQVIFAFFYLQQRIICVVLLPTKNFAHHFDPKNLHLGSNAAWSSCSNEKNFACKTCYARLLVQQLHDLHRTKKFNTVVLLHNRINYLHAMKVTPYCTFFIKTL